MTFFAHLSSFPLENWPGSVFWLYLSDDEKKIQKFQNLGLILADFRIFKKGRKCVNSFKTAVQIKHFFDLTCFHIAESVEGNLEKKISKIGPKLTKIWLILVLFRTKIRKSQVKFFNNCLSCISFVTS